MRNTTDAVPHHIKKQEEGKRSRVEKTGRREVDLDHKEDNRSLEGREVELHEGAEY